MEVLVCTLLLIVGLAFFYLKRRDEKGKTPPGSLGLPFVGETLKFLSSLKANQPWTFIYENQQKHGPIFKTSILGSRTVVVPAPSGNKFVFSNEGKVLVNTWPSSVARLLGPNSPALKTGQAHKRSRAVLMAFLKPEALQKYVGRVSRTATRFLSQNWEGKEQVRGFQSMKAFTLSLVSELFFGVENEADQEALRQPIHHYVAGIFALPVNLPGTRYYRALQGRRTLIHQINQHLSKRRDDLRSGLVSSDQDLLSVLITTPDEGHKFASNAEIADTILLLLFAGHDTSSCVLTMALKYLAENPAWKDKLLQEHLELASACRVSGDEEYTLNWDDLTKMKWTWRVVQESLRLQPPVQGTFREATTDFEYEGFKIPKGWKLYWTVNSSFRKPEYFPEPDKFDPTRFETSPAPYTFTPFGGGPRMCPGNEFARMEMLVFLHYLILKYDWELADKDEVITIDPMPFPKKGLVLNIRRR